MRGKAGYPPAVRVAAPLQFEREHQARELLTGCSPPSGDNALRLQVVEVDAAAPCRHARQRDHAGLAPPPHVKVAVVGGEREVSEVVRGELQLVTIA